MVHPLPGAHAEIHAFRNGVPKDEHSMDEKTGPEEHRPEREIISSGFRRLSIAFNSSAMGDSNPMATAITPASRMAFSSSESFALSRRILNGHAKSGFDPFLIVP